MQITPIAKIYNDFDSKFAVPRQSGLVNSIKSKIIFEKEYASAEAFKGLEEYSHLWLIWEFDKNAHESDCKTAEARWQRKNGSIRHTFALQTKSARAIKCRVREDNTRKRQSQPNCKRCGFDKRNKDLRH